ncbi:hypothetical protein TIFTF001_005110 [Ficus carica]|uniref:Uncharacterized protein n=1 Tax=Ficus carica TaxID=3494 RepID=A0AA87ZDW3_FICCA|nr:hypothetical protein TIFTF001_005110 [Ficus carica]
MVLLHHRLHQRHTSQHIGELADASLRLQQRSSWLLCLYIPPEQETLKVRGFVSLYPDKLVSLDTTHTPEFLSLNPSQGLWPTSSYGEGVVVGVIDSGVWPESRRFNDTNMTRVSPTSWKGSCDHEDSYI